jgi:hypothetical protein
MTRAILPSHCGGSVPRRLASGHPCNAVSDGEYHFTDFMDGALAHLPSEPLRRQQRRTIAHLPAQDVTMTQQVEGSEARRLCSVGLTTRLASVTPGRSKTIVTVEPVLTAR